MHLEEAFRLLKNPRLNFLESVGKDVLTQVRKLVIQLVLATDLAQHFGIVGTFKNVFSSCWEKVTRYDMHCPARNRVGGEGGGSRVGRANGSVRVVQPMLGGLGRRPLRERISKAQRCFCIPYTASLCVLIFDFGFLLIFPLLLFKDMGHAYHAHTTRGSSAHGPPQLTRKASFGGKITEHLASHRSSANHALKRASLGDVMCCVRSSWETNAARF
jgi:hypothetical protein